jgi:SAM-dependent methyltransferase
MTEILLDEILYFCDYRIMNEIEGNVKEVVREKYGEAARRVATGKTSCCSSDPITSGLYTLAQSETLPEAALLASLGCGNPTALAQLQPGETVLDLGSGGGIDVLLSARRVGPTGKAYGLDMTDDMLALARDNQQKAGVQNVEFLKGEIEHIPLPDNSIDVIISTCVINLSADKDSVPREAFRVLKPGGRFAVSDVVVRGEVPAELKRNVELWVGCVAGALEESDYKAKLTTAGFTCVDLEPTRVYTVDDAKSFLTESGLNTPEIAQQMDGKFASMFVRAIKPIATVEVFDPAMCCSTGVCGPAPNPVLPRFAADLDWLASQGVTVLRHNLSQDPAPFAANDAVKAALTEMGTDCLPLIIVNGEVKSKGKYPVRYTLAHWAGVPMNKPVELPVLMSSGPTSCC